MKTYRPKPMLIKNLGSKYPTKTSQTKRWYGLYTCPSCLDEFEAMKQAVQAGTKTRCKNCADFISIKVPKQLKTCLAGMRQRIYYEKNINYHRYGGRGITMCKDWTQDSITFYKWAFSNGFKDGLTIDRIDSDKGYEPSNCRWLSLEENTRLAVNRESKSKSIKINSDDASEICEMYDTGKFTYPEIASHYKVSKQCIGKIVREAKL